MKRKPSRMLGAPQTGKTAGAGAAGFLKKNWKWLVPVACVAVLERCVAAQAQNRQACQRGYQLCGDRARNSGTSSMP